MSRINDGPDEVNARLCSFLGVKDTATLMQTCTSMRVRLPRCGVVGASRTPAHNRS
jgi:hypothetical protein